MNEVILGIDLGTTNSAVGLVDSGFPILLANKDNERIIPSAVWYGPDGEIEVGQAALRRRHTPLGDLVTSAKRLIGQTKKTAPDFSLPLTEVEGKLQIQLSSQQVSPEDVSAEILKHLRSIAKERLGYEVNKAVITVPAYFNDSQRAATKSAGEKAGFQVERILSEPTAAALSFGLDKLEASSKVIVYDLGGGTFDVSLLELNDGVFQVIATSGDTHLGGDDIDLLVAEHLWNSSKTEDFSLLPRDLKSKLITEAKKAKEKLSKDDIAEVSVPFLSQSEHFQASLSRKDFEKWISPLIDKTISHCQKVLHDSELFDKKEEIKSIILVGGSSRIPLVQRKVEAYFSKKPDLSQHPDEAIALGAVIQAGVISGAIKDIVLLDVTPLSLGIETYGGLMNVIIPRNTTIPCKAGEMFTNAIDSQSSVSINILQGEREMARDNWPLGKVKVPFKPALKGQARIGVQFSIDENGILEVLTRDTADNKDTILKIEAAAVDVTDEKIEEMVAESVEFAFEDMAERIFTEATLKAKELLPAVEVALAQVGDSLEEDEKRCIEEAKMNVEREIETKDAKALKAAVQELDKQTEYLATMLIEKAMEEALLKKLGE